MSTLKYLVFALCLVGCFAKLSDEERKDQIRTHISTLANAFAIIFVLICVFFCAWLSYHYDAFLYKTKCKDKKWDPTPDPKPFLENSRKIDSKKVYFIRHGESTWNVVFNRNKLLLLFRLAYACIYETYLAFTNGDSWFIDSPLCEVGVNQAAGLRRFIKENRDTDEDAQILSRSAGEGSLVICSNLRRCISTAFIGLYDRFKETEEKMVVLPSLQEITDNPDSLSLALPYQNPKASWNDVSGKCFEEYQMEKLYATQLECNENSGNKAIDGNGLQRINKFNEWLFANVDEKTVIVCGHSLWFKSYFNEFLPRDVKHVGKKKKMKNGACVTFTVDCYQTAKGLVYQIQPDTMKVVYLGFKS